LVEWMSCHLAAKSSMADSAARADITVVLRDFAANLAVSRAGSDSGARSSVKDSPMEFERPENEGGPLQQALLWLSRSQKSAHRCVTLTQGKACSYKGLYLTSSPTWIASLKKLHIRAKSL
jgi:hypothetical protein